MIFLTDEYMSELFGVAMAEQLLEAGILLGVGMSVVFVFLTLLIGGIHCIAWIGRQFPEPVKINTQNTSASSQASATKKGTSTAVPDAIVKAITAAIHTHRRENN